MMRRHWLSIIVAALFGAVVWLLVLWQPARQVRRHTEQLLATIERKNWKRLGELMADDYSDSWGHDKSGLIADAREVFAQFFAIELRAHEMVVAESDGSGTAKARLALRGSGGGLAQLAIERAAALREPFVFTWRLRSGKPWDWILVRVEQPELRAE